MRSNNNLKEGERMKKILYIKENDEPIWLEFQRLCEKEGASVSKKIMELIRHYCKPSYEAILSKSPYAWTHEDTVFVRVYEGKT
jgi:hypothetical protein